MDDEKYLKMRAALDAVGNANKVLRPVRENVQHVQSMRRAFINQPVYPRRVDGLKEPTSNTIYIKNQNGMEGAGGMKMSHPMKQYLTKNLQDVKSRLAQAEAELEREAKLLKNAEMRAKGGLVGNDGAKTLQYNMQQGLNAPFLPGNVGDINRVIWPFWFTTSKVTLAPNQSINANFTVTQEAGFVMMSYTRAIFMEAAQAGNFVLIDPDQPNGSGKANDLSFTIRDSQSSRIFNNIPQNANQVGYWKKPTILPTPQLFLPNSNIQISWQNNSQTNTYRPFLSFFGYRLRIDHAKDILGTVVG